MHLAAAAHAVPKHISDAPPTPPVLRPTIHAVLTIREGAASQKAKFDRSKKPRLKDLKPSADLLDVMPSERSAKEQRSIHGRKPYAVRSPPKKQVNFEKAFHIVSMANKSKTNSKDSHIDYSSTTRNSNATVAPQEALLDAAALAQKLETSPLSKNFDKGKLVANDSITFSNREFAQQA